MAQTAQLPLETSDPDLPDEAHPARAPRPRRSFLALTAGVLGVIVLGVALLALVLYAIDYEINADVTRTDCVNDRVVVETRQFSITHAVTGIPPAQCLLLEEGNFVEYHIRTKHTRLFDVEGGDCIYDSVTGIC